jgi:D-arabinose 1-dehydrogenase-like Zn-dependent alcohol dehydrogenase
MARVGQRIMVHHYKGCTVCEHCRSGWSQLCQEEPVLVYGNNAHGGHARYLKVPAFTLVPLHDELSFTAGAAISCGTGTAYGALRRLNISGNDTIALFGHGPVGLSATQLAAAMGARVIALDVSPERLERAKEFGAWETVNPRSNDPVGAIKDLTHGGADFTLDTSSQPEGRIAAVRSAKVWGTVAFVGERNNVTIDVSPDMLQGRRRPPLHPPMEARPSRRSLPPVRHPDYRQGRLLDVTAIRRHSRERGCQEILRTDNSSSPRKRGPRACPRHEQGG